MPDDELNRDKTFYVMATNVTPPGATTTNDVLDNHSDVTSANVTTHARDEALAQIEIGVQAFIFCLALVGNSCVLLALRYRKKKTSRMHQFIMHLSIADLLVAFCNVLPQLAWDITYRFQGSDALCRVVKYLQVMVVYLSTYVLVMTAVDRYRAICHPLSNYSWSSKRVKVMIGSAWGLSLFLSIPQLVIFRLTEVSPGVYDCWGHFGDTEWLMKAYITCFMLSVYILPFFILVLLYGRISYELWWNLRAKRTGNLDGGISNGKIVYKFNGTGTISIISPNDTKTHIQDLSGSSLHNSYREREREWERDPYVKRQQQQLMTSRCTCQCHSRHGNRPPVTSGPVARPHTFRGLSRSKMKTIKLTFVVILAYLLCWSPFFITQMWWAFDKHAPASNSTFVICLLLASLNSCCNPWIYMAFSTNFIQSALPCCRSRPRPPPYHHHRVCSVDDGRGALGMGVGQCAAGGGNNNHSSSRSESLTPDESSQNRMEKHLIEPRSKMLLPPARMPGAIAARGATKCTLCGSTGGVGGGVGEGEKDAMVGAAKTASSASSSTASWRWRCNLFPASYKTRGGTGNGSSGLLRAQQDAEQCQPLQEIQEERGGSVSDPARDTADRWRCDGPSRRRSSFERYLQGRRARKSLSHPSLLQGGRSCSDEKLEVRCTSV